MSGIDRETYRITMAYDYVRNNFFYILNEEDFSVKSILDSAKILVKTRGVKVASCISKHIRSFAFTILFVMKCPSFESHSNASVQFPL